MSWTGRLTAAFLLVVGVAGEDASGRPIVGHSGVVRPLQSYRVIVFHHGPLDPEHAAIVQALNSLIDRDPPVANFKFQRVDLLQSPRDPLMNLLPRATPESPWMVVRYPDRAWIRESVWAGPLTWAAVRALLDSPVRRRIARRLRAGDAAVWVILEGGHRSRDAAAARFLEARLARVRHPLGRPVFSLVPVSRGDSAERMFVRMLLGSEPDLAERSDPMVFPVFGEGRMLEGLIGAGINEENIHEYIAALSGDTQGLSGGLDLLLARNGDPFQDGRRGDFHAYVGPASAEAPTPRRTMARATGMSSGERGAFLAGLLLMVLTFLRWSASGRRPRSRER